MYMASFKKEHMLQPDSNRLMIKCGILYLLNVMFSYSTLKYEMILSILLARRDMTEILLKRSKPSKSPHQTKKIDMETQLR